ncbi:MAG: peptidylprolyl isomerase [Clostridia bacterium]|nr:peptidylprolyl isomerase [Clostridia bacterium]MBQ9037923.1 peptidylprolyl isomerase [Clostridia bacterium]
MRGRAHLLILFLVLILVLSQPAWAEVAEDPVCVRVGEFSYPLSLVQKSLDSLINMAQSQSEESLTDEEKAEMAVNVIDNFVGIGLVEAKLTEEGKHDFSEQEEELLRGAASSRYEEIWQSVYKMMQANDMDATQEEVSKAVADEGYDMDNIYREYLVSERQQRAIELYVGDIPITRDELDEYYETQYVAPDRERYKDDIPRYEREILNTDSESFYTPEGYRLVRQILLNYPDGVIESLKREQADVERAVKNANEKMAALTQMVLTTDDWSNLDAPKAEYDAAMEALKEAKLAYMQARRDATMPLIQDRLDEIDERLSAGIDFVTLITQYSADTSERNVTGQGYPLHALSEGWPEEFISAGLALEKVGDVSEPVLTEKGVHILCYVGDLPAGDHVLTEHEEELLEQSALHASQVEALEALFEKWKPHYDIETHPELLKY